MRSCRCTRNVVLTLDAAGAGLAIVNPLHGSRKTYLRPSGFLLENQRAQVAYENEPPYFCEGKSRRTP